MLASSSVMWPEPVSRCWKTRPVVDRKLGGKHLQSGTDLETCRLGSTGCRIHAGRIYEDKKAKGGNGET